VLFQQVTEGFIGELLKIHRAVTGQHVQRVQSFVVEFDSLTYSRYLRWCGEASAVSAASGNLFWLFVDCYPGRYPERFSAL